MTIEDPDTYNQPWQVIRRFSRPDRFGREHLPGRQLQPLHDYGIGSQQAGFLTGARSAKKSRPQCCDRPLIQP
jgi:hypothetical protein